MAGDRSHNTTPVTLAFAVVAVCVCASPGANRHGEACLESLGTTFRPQTTPDKNVTESARGAGRGSEGGETSGLKEEREKGDLFGSADPATAQRSAGQKRKRKSGTWCAGGRRRGMEQGGKVWDITHGSGRMSPPTATLVRLPSPGTRPTSLFCRCWPVGDAANCLCGPLRHGCA
jgi:hypothetical protein